MDYRPISADSHITEPPDCYTARIDRSWKDKAPHIVHDARFGDVFAIDQDFAMGWAIDTGHDPQEGCFTGQGAA